VILLAITLDNAIQWNEFKNLIANPKILQNSNSLLKFKQNGISLGNVNKMRKKVKEELFGQFESK
jgi:hypothetical protein